MPREKIKKPGRVLVFSPHPDDDVIGCGGTIARLAAAGTDVRVVYLTSGEKGGKSSPPGRLGLVREAEAARAARTLGVTETLFWRLPDAALAPSPRAISRAAELLLLFRPQTVYVTHPDEAHADHRAAAAIVAAALALAARHKTFRTPRVFFYEIWTPLAVFDAVEDVTRQMPKKLKALRCHKSQIRQYRFDEGVEGLNRYRGVMTAKGKHCECFARWKPK